MLKTLTDDNRINRGELWNDPLTASPVFRRAFSPQYPYLATRDNVEGWVVLRFVVDAEGFARKAEVVSAEPEGLFEEAALKAVARYKFKPAVKDGEAVRCITRQRIRFQLDW